MARLHRILFPRPRRSAPTSAGHELAVLALLAALAIAGPLDEQLLHGREQGCAVVFAGVGWGCGPWVPPGEHEVAYPYATQVAR